MKSWPRNGARSAATKKRSKRAKRITWGGGAGRSPPGKSLNFGPSEIVSGAILG